MTFLGLDAQFWSLLADAATAVGCAIVVVTLLAALYQLSEMRKSRSLAGLVEAFRLVDAPEACQGRRFIYGLSKAPGTLTPQEQEELSDGLRYLEDLSYLVKASVLPKDEFLGLHFITWLKVWSKAEAHILCMRQARCDITWASNLEWLAHEAEDYRRRDHHQVDVRVAPPDDADEAAAPGVKDGGADATALVHTASDVGRPSTSARQREPVATGRRSG